MSELLESRWLDTKNALLEGLQGNKKAVMATTLENTRKYLSKLQQQAQHQQVTSQLLTELSYQLSDV